MKKWIVVFVAVLLLLSFAGPTSSENGWKINAETIGSVENVAQNVSSWIKNQDLSQEFDELFMQIKEFLQALEQFDDLEKSKGRLLKSHHLVNRKRKVTFRFRSMKVG